MPLLAPFFSGWLGFGSSLDGFVITEPSDPAYVRRAISYGPLDGQYVRDVSAGSIGPASSAWATLLVAGLFDAQSGGDLLAVIPLARPCNVGVGGTVTNAQQFGFRLSACGELSPATTLSWFAGSELGTTDAGFSVVACSSLQLSHGTLKAVSASSSGLSISSLPAAPPAAGSGQLWNNGGVICIA